MALEIVDLTSIAGEEIEVSNLQATICSSGSLSCSSIIPKVAPVDGPREAAGITCRNSSPPKSYWTNASGGIKLVNALSKESVGQSYHGLEPPNDRFIHEVGARSMFASLTRSSCRLASFVIHRAASAPEKEDSVRRTC